MRDGIFHHNHDVMYAMGMLHPDGEMRFMDLTTPAVLFPAISLLLLAYTNRFMGLAALIRSLHDRHHAHPDPTIVAQIGNLRFRVWLIQNMQAAGVLSLFLCVTCMMLLFAEQIMPAKIAFALSLVLMAASLSHLSG